jgi:hypothetical protein
MSFFLTNEVFRKLQPTGSLLPGQVLQGSAEYKKLLEIGKLRIKGVENNDLEPHSNVEELLPLNNYVYTYYSTNANDKSYSIEFVILADFLDPLLNKLEENGLWYMAKNYKTNEFKEFYDDRHSNTEVLDRLVPNNQLQYFGLRYPDKPTRDWYLVNDQSLPNNVSRIRRDKADIYFLSPFQVMCIQNEYAESNYFLQMGFIPELELPPHNINIKLLSQNIAVVTIEDPTLYRKELYNDLLEILKNIVYLLNCIK